MPRKKLPVFGLVSFHLQKRVSFQFHLIFFSFHFAWEQYVRLYFSQQFAQSHLSWVVLQGMVLDILPGMDYRNISIKFVPGFTEEKFSKIAVWYEEWGWPLVFLAGFSPIPYKIFTISSGVLGMALLPFTIASGVSRSARFFLVAILIAKFGEPMKEKIDKHFNMLAFSFWHFTNRRSFGGKASASALSSYKYSCFLFLKNNFCIGIHNVHSHQFRSDSPLFPFFHPKKLEHS